jgi:endoglucanase
MRTGTHSTLLDLLDLPTAPLNEGHVVDYIRGWAAKRPAIKLSQDRAGNVVLRLRRGAKTRGPLVLAAHMDHPGFEARRMRGANRLEAAWLGWVHPDYFPGTRVRFYSEGRWIRGAIRVVKVAMIRGRRRVRTAEIDVARPVAPGSIGMWDLPDPVVRGDKVYARGCDDIAGVAAILDAMDVLARSRGSVNVMGLLTRAEEIGFAGAIAACKAGTIPKDARIVAVEISSEIPGVRMGDGPVLRVGDAGSIFSPGLTAFCRVVAEDLARKSKDFKFQRKLMDGGTCESTVYYARGYDATGLCVALGNYHNMDTRRKRIAAEYIHLEDYRGLVRWFTALATTRRPYDSSRGVLEAMIARLDRVQAPQLRRTVERVQGRESGRRTTG